MMTVDQLLSLLKDCTEKYPQTVESYPIYKSVCDGDYNFKELGGNLRFRHKIITKACKDRKFANEVWMMCHRDMLFFINTFAMTYNPQLTPKITTIPLITYEYQDVGLHELVTSILDQYDIATEKSRKMGLTWLILTIYLWLWLFRPDLTFRVLSIKEDLVDKTDDPDSLFWKLLFLIKYLPPFIIRESEYARNHLMLKNLNTNSSIIGLATTSDSARSGRCTSMFPDEFAFVPDAEGVEKSTQSVSDSRIFNSTHNGAATKFYKLLQKPTMAKLSLHWSLHPIFSKGMYYSKNGKLMLLDDRPAIATVSRISYKFPEEYPFRLDGKLRSPWYDNECDRASHPMVIAQELDMDPFASDFQFFDMVKIQEIERRDIREPFHVGSLEYDADTLEMLDFIENKKGRLKLWIHPDIQNKIQRGLEVICGADVSAGAGASNSSASFICKNTGEKLAEYVNPWLSPESFAKEVAAMCYWFNEAYLIWDASGGTGSQFSKAIIELGYRNIYYRRNEKTISKKVSDAPGFYITGGENGTKTALLGAYRLALHNGGFIQRSHDANEECRAYVFTGSSVEHSSSLQSTDPSGARSNHGDIACADALASHGRTVLGGGRLKKAEAGPSTNCWAARKKQAEDLKKKKDVW